MSPRRHAQAVGRGLPFDEIVLAGSATQMSHEHHPARAADRDGNDGQCDGAGRAGGQTLPEHGVGAVLTSAPIAIAAVNAPQPTGDAPAA